MKPQLAVQISFPAKKSSKRKISHAYIGPLKHLINLLIVRRLSQKQIAEHTGLNHLTAGRYVRELHRGPKNLIYICDYKRSATVGPYTAIYTWGPGEQDVPRPPPLPKSSRNYQQRLARKQRTITTETGVIHHADR